MRPQFRPQRAPARLGAHPRRCTFAHSQSPRSPGPTVLVASQPRPDRHAPSSHSSFSRLFPPQSEAPLGKINWNPPRSPGEPPQDANELIHAMSEGPAQAAKGAAGGGGLRKVAFSRDGSAGAGAGGEGQATPTQRTKQVMSRGDMAHDKFGSASASHAYARCAAGAPNPPRMSRDGQRKSGFTAQALNRDSLSTRPLAQEPQRRHALPHGPQHGPPPPREHQEADGGPALRCGDSPTHPLSLSSNIALPRCV